jgi:hypothetical protein
MYYKDDKYSIIGEICTLCISVFLKLKCGDIIETRCFNTFINYRIYYVINLFSRSRWPRGQRRGSTAARLLELWI